jgi:hypothetical protein
VRPVDQLDLFRRQSGGHESVSFIFHHQPHLVHFLAHVDPLGGRQVALLAAVEGGRQDAQVGTGQFQVQPKSLGKMGSPRGIGGERGRNRRCRKRPPCSRRPGCVCPPGAARKRRPAPRRRSRSGCKTVQSKRSFRATPETVRPLRCFSRPGPRRFSLKSPRVMLRHRAPFRR